MTNGAVDFHNMQQIEKLRHLLGENECRRLGFILDGERDVAVLATAGLGYLLYIAESGKITADGAEAFAAGYQCSAEVQVSE